MTDVKISQLPAAASLVPAADSLPIVTTGITKKVTPNLLVDSVLVSPGPIGSTTPSTGAFSTLTLTGASGILKATAGLFSSAIAGTDYIAPGGALGTPSSGTLTNCTGLPIATGVSGLASGVATFLATPTSANLASAVTDETGTGALVFANTPTLITPILGTPTSGTLTNCTGLPLTGTTGTLAVNRGGTGAVTLTGLVKGNGTSAFTAAVSGTDYAPATSGTSILYGSGSGGFSNVTIGSGLTFSGGTLSSSVGSGTVTTVSVVSSNGLAGTVANPTTTPAITLSTTVTGIVKGNGTSFSAAVSGTDYAPATSGSSILKGNGAGGFSAAVAGTDYAAAPTGTSSQLLATNGSGGFSNVTVGSGLSYSGGTLASTSGGGSVTTVSVVSANGFAGTVANPSSTPAITLSTSVTGLLKGNGTAISAAVSGTDYAPATSGTSILYGNGSGGFSPVTIGTNLTFSGGTLSASGGGGGVTSVTATSPLASSGGTTPNLTIQTASGSQSGALSSTDWTTFNNKGSGTVTSVGGTGTVNGLTLTGTVTSSGNLTLGGTLDLSSPPAIGGTTPAAGAFTSLSATRAVTLSPTIGGVTISPSNATTGVVTINPTAGGTIDNVAIGNTTQANGHFTALSATGTTTLQTSLTGLLKATSGVVSTATSGTDYAPATSGTSILKGNGSGGFASAVSGTDYAPATSGSSILYGNGSGGFSAVTVGSGLTFSGGTLASTGGGSGTVTSVSGTGTVSGITLTGTVTTSGSLTLGGTLSLASPGAIGGTTPSTAAFTSVNTANTFGFKNRIINGGMTIDQRNAGASVTGNNGVYTVDRWQASASQSGKFTAQQNAGAVATPSGFPNYLGITSSSSYSVTASDTFSITQAIEGFNLCDLSWGSSNAKSITLSFVVYSSLTGTFGGVVSNYAKTRSYPFTYTISSANTWTNVSITISGDTSGTWVGASNAGAAYIGFGLGAGSTYSGTAGSWSSNAYYTATGATSVVGTSGATFYITGVQLEVGSQATSFDFRSIGQELALCQRYYEKSYATEVAPGASTNYYSGGMASVLNGYSSTIYTFCVFYYKAQKRASPTMAYWDAAGNASKLTYLTGGGLAQTDNISGAVYTINSSESCLFANILCTPSYNYMFHWTASAEL